jgi:multidrug efflux pump subunit AcrB
VEYANHVREHEPTLDALESMKKAGPLRLRPILMTTVATMMSAVPPILGLGPGTETRSPMAAAVLGGLTVSTVLSLLMVPSFYVVADRAKAALASFLFRKKVEPPASPEHT